MTPLIRIGLLIVAGSIGLGAVLSTFASPTDMSLAGLAITFLAVPMFFVGATCLAVGVVGSLGQTGRRIAYTTVAVGIVATAIVLWRASVLWPSGPHVSGLVLETDQPHYRGPCPATITLRARITVDRGSGLVAYEFRGYSPTRSKGEIHFEAPATKTATGAITFGAPGYAVAGPGDLRVRIAQLGSREARADFQYVCTR